jgi:hypothetical protein
MFIQLLIDDDNLHRSASTWLALSVMAAGFLEPAAIMS